MMNHSIYAAIHHEKTQLLQYEGAVWNQLDSANMLTSTDVQKSMEAIFDRLLMFNANTEELMHTYFKRDKGKLVVNEELYGVKYTKSRCRKTINSFRNANIKYLRKVSDVLSKACTVQRSTGNSKRDCVGILYVEERGKLPLLPERIR